MYAAGDIVIITHPMILDRHVVAEIVSTTKATCRVHYWNDRGKNDEAKQRKLDAIVGKVPAKYTPEAMVMMCKTAAELRDEIIRRANTQYNDNIKSYTEQGT